MKAPRLFGRDEEGIVNTGEEQSRLVKSRHDYLPFGEEITANVNGRTPEQGYVVDGVRQKFTAKERDIETGLDFFLARYYSSAQGRFTSPDEFEGGPDELFDFTDDASDNPTFYADPTNPQSLNKYQYGFNNPLRYTDPDGHCSDCDEPRVDPVIQTTITAAKGFLLGGVGGAVIAVLIDPPSVGAPTHENPDVGQAPTYSEFLKSEGKSLAVGLITPVPVKGGRALTAAEREVDALMPSSRAARREAMRREGIPTRQQPKSQARSRDGSRRGYDYDVPALGGRTQTKMVNNDPRPRDPKVNKLGPHWEAGRAKTGGRRDQYGRTRITGRDKKRVGY